MSVAQTLYVGLSIGALYAIIALGFTLIFGVGGVLNLAHGGLVTLGGFSGYLVTNNLGLGPWIALVVGGLSGAAVGALIYIFIKDLISNNQFMSIIILTFLIGFGIQHALRIYITGLTISMPRLVGGSTQVPGASVQNMSIVVFVLSWLLLGVVYATVNYTRVGKAIIATSMNSKGAKITGIDTDSINLYTWIMAASLAGIAGVLLVMLQTGSWNMGNDPLVLSFSIVILGGIGSIKGSVVGAYIIGLTETFTVSFIDSRLTGLSALLLLVAFLLIKPEGLFGREVEA